jgi:ribosomal protein L30/L7E
MEPVKFVALDREDLEVISAHLQDALVKVADILWRPQEKRLVAALNRFDWLSAQANHPKLRRCLSVLRLDRVNSCKCRSVNPAGKDAILNLLAVEFHETDPPAGVITLTFSGGGALRLEVECLEAELADLGPSWPAAARPIHLEDTAEIRVDASSSPGH